MSIKALSKNMGRLYLLFALFLAMTGCGPDPFYIEVASIEGVPETGTAGTPLALTGTVRPAFASNKNIVWSVEDAGTTCAGISGNILSTEAVGTVTIRATVPNGIAEGKAYTQDFLINVVEGNIGGGETEEEPITEVGIFVTGPSKNGVPDTVAIGRPEDGGKYAIGEVSWSPDDNPFKGLTVYTAMVTLTANEGYTFTGLTTATINGEEETSITDNTGTTVTLSYTFAKTLDKEIIGLSIKTQPQTLAYTHGDTLDLSGLVVTLAFDTSSPEDVAYGNFGAYNISTLPAHDEALTLAHNGQPIVVMAGGHTASTNNLTVNKGIELISSAAITVTGPAKDEVPDTAASPSLEDIGKYATGAVSWSPGDNPFKGGTAYKATVTLTANEGYTFTGLASATINGEGASITDNTGMTVTLSYTFEPTLNKEITGITIRSQPNNLTYSSGETLNLSGLVIVLTFDSGSPEEVAFNNFNNYNISANPAHGTPLSYTTHNGIFIKISVGDHSVNTEKLTVAPLESGENSTRETAIQLTLNTWANGNITVVGGEQWFKFTATATTHYIHFEPGTLTSVYVQLYNDAGSTVGSRTNLTGSTLSTSRTVTIGSVYYIRVTPYSSSGKGTYRIAVTSSAMSPTTEITTLTINVWADGNIAAAGGEQWFKFTATATTHYIHFETGTLSDVNVQLYNEAGLTVGSQTNLYSSVLNTSRTVTVGSVYYIRLTPYSSSNKGAYRIGVTTSSIPPPSITIPTTDVTSLTINVWADGDIAATGGEQWFKFTATATTHYIHFESGALTSVYVQLYNDVGSIIGSRSNLTGSTLNTSRAVTIGGVYYIKVTPYSSSGKGAYRIAVTASSIPPPSITIPTTDVTSLTINVWGDGDITATGDEQWFKFTATATTHYIHFDPETLTSVYVQLYNDAGSTVGNRANLTDSTLNTSRTVTIGSVYYIKVTPYSGNGTYRIAVTSSIIPPTTDNITSLTINVWADGNIAVAGGEQWFKFTATATTHYIYFETGSLSDVYVQMYNNAGSTVGSQTNLYSSVLYTSRTVTVGSEYYIRLTPYSSSNKGAYRIAVTDSSLPPPSATIPTTGITPLTFDVWADGNIAAAGDEQWFKFTATATTQYIYFESGTLTSVYVQLYNDNGSTVGSRANLTSSTLYTSRTVTVGNVYYIKVTPYSSSGKGAYRIKFNASSPSITIPTTGITSLTINVWADGNITAAGGEQWFKFTATAATQYIHFEPGALSDVYVQLYNDAGSTVGSQTNLYSSTLYTSRAVTVGSVYYIKLTPYSSSGKGAYRIGVTSSTSPPSTTIPTTGITSLTINIWTDGNIAATGGEQWFKFTATATTHYIHFDPGTLTSVYVQLYNDAGSTVGSRASLSYSALNTSRTVTIGSVYYIRVTPYSGNGAYRITTNTSSIPPPTITIPTTDITTLTFDVWANGNIAATGGEQWFKFTATSATHYIHFDPGTLNSIYVQLYDDTDSTIGSMANLSGSTLNTSRAVTAGNVYYIKVTPYSGNGAYRIGITSSTSPPAF